MQLMSGTLFALIHHRPKKGLSCPIHPLRETVFPMIAQFLNMALEKESRQNYYPQTNQKYHNSKTLCLPKFK